MPLSTAAARREIHHRVIDMKAYAREDGLYDIEAHLVDRKPFALRRLGSTDRIPTEQPIHDMWIRLAVDDQYCIRSIEAASDTTPYAVCKEAESTLEVLTGERIGSGWSARVKKHLRGTASCTHLRELLIPMATTAIQGVEAWLRARDGLDDTNRVEALLDSCYGHARHQWVVKVHSPRRYVRVESEATKDRSKA